MAEPVPAPEQIMIALETLLNTLSGVTVERNVDEEITTLPAIALMDGDTDSEPLSPYERRYTMTFELVYLVEGSGGRINGPAISGLWAQVVALFSANETLGGIVRYMEEVSLVREGSERDEGRVPTGGAIHSWRTEFYTGVGQPYTLLTTS